MLKPVTVVELSRANLQRLVELISWHIQIIESNKKGIDRFFPSALHPQMLATRIRDTPKTVLKKIREAKMIQLSMVMALHRKIILLPQPSLLEWHARERVTASTPSTHLHLLVPHFNRRTSNISRSKCKQRETTIVSVAVVFFVEEGGELRLVWGSSTLVDCFLQSSQR